MAHREILLVEDRPDDERLTIRALKKANLLNDITVVRDGAEALDYLFCTGRYADRAPCEPPAPSCWTSICRRSTGLRFYNGCGPTNALGLSP